MNPLLKDLLAGMDYYWVTDQAEYATDVMFKSPAALKPLYDKLVKHASTCFSAEDVLKFLGRKLHGNYQGEVLSEFKVRRQSVRKGQEVIDWFPLCKGVANLFRYAEICRGANRRYLDALAAVEPPVEAMRGLRHRNRSRALMRVNRHLPVRRCLWLLRDPRPGNDQDIWKGCAKGAA